MQRAIVHMDLDSFFVSVERLNNPSLIGKPIIVGGSAERGVVCSCSYEARKFGVHAAMSGKMARMLCPEAIFVRGDYEHYTKYSNQVTEIIKEQCPVVEKASIDEHYMDISGMDRYLKNSLLFTSELKQKITKESGLPISFGLSVNKTVSKIATNEGKPNGQKFVHEGNEKEFLAPLTIDKIPMVGEKTHMKLRQLGVSKIETVQQMPIERMEMVLGENGIIIWKKANGLDNSPVIPYSEQKSIGTQETFPEDTIDIYQLKNTLNRMVFETAFELRNKKKLTGCVTLKIRYTDFQTYTFDRSIPFTSSDTVLYNTVMDLFKKNYTRRVLVRLIGIKFSKLVSGHHQIHLFEETEEHVKLYQALDKIRHKYGAKAVAHAITLIKAA